MRTKIAFLILAHTDPRQLARLCRALGRDDDIFVHVDQRASIAPFANQDLPENVHFIQQRVPVFWADISIVEATLKLIEEAMRKETDYLRLVLLSGGCYPIKSIDVLRTYFIGRGEEHLDLKYTNVFKSTKEGLSLFSNFHFKRPWIPQHRRTDEINKYVAIPDKAARKLSALLLRPIDRGFRRKFPDLVPYTGSQFWAITPPCAEMILRFVQERPDFLHYHRYSFAPDEHFFHTIIGNCAFAAKTDGPVAHLGGQHLYNLHAARYPLVSMEHLAEIVDSEKFFIRKVLSGKSDPLLDYLDEHLLR